MPPNAESAIDPTAIEQARIIDVDWGAIVAFVLGAGATWAFEYGIPGYLQGPAARALGGTDLSWLAGAIVAGLCYYAASRARQLRPVRAAGQAV